MDADAEALIALMSTTPDATRQTLISDTIVALKDAGIWTLLDECWFLAAHTSQAALLGWKRYKNATSVNAPAFEADRGFTGDGMTSYLNTNFVPNTDGVNYALNNASFGVYSRTDSNAAVDMGSRDTTSLRRAFLQAKISDEFLGNANNGSGAFVLMEPADSLGLFVARRASSTEITGFKNGTSGAAVSVNSTSPPSHAMYIGAVNTNGSTSNYTTRQYAFAFVAAAMSGQQQADLYQIVQDYMISLEADV